MPPAPAAAGTPSRPERALEESGASGASARRHFTVEEASQSLPRIVRLMQSLQQRYGWLDGHRQEPRFMLAEYRIVEEGPVDQEYVQALLGIRRALREMERIGAQVKDV